MNTKPHPIDRFNAELPCQVLVLTSPKAGSGRNREQLGRLRQLLGEASVLCRMFTDVAELMRAVDQSRASHSTVLVAAGGDGTVALAAAKVGPSVPIVPLPLGTENLLARHFGHHAIAESVITTIRHGNSFALDAGLAGNRPFLIMATCGFDAEVVRGVHLTRRGHISRLSYLGPTVRALLRYPFTNMTVIVDGERLEGRWVMVFNLPCYGGGLNIEPGAVGNDGLLDVIIFRRGSILSGLKYVAGIGLGRHHRFSDVIRLRGRSVQITSAGRVPYELDGDYAGRLPLEIGINPGQVELLLPPTPIDER